ncbi:MAG: radical SAM protein [Candidatus Micrarchaeota archaeon]
MRVALGTAITMGLAKGKMESPPTTAHFLVGEGCAHSCAYCGVNESTIARIEWPKFPVENVLSSSFSGFERACLQLTSNGFDEAIPLIKKIPVPVSVSLRAEGEKEIEQLFEAGADKVCLPLDGCTPEISERICREGFERTFELLEWAGKRYPGRIATHLIMGLGETERDAVELLNKLSGIGVYAGLFAFTPAKGSRLAENEKPHVGAYRRVQIARYLVTKNGTTAFDYNSKNQLIRLPGVPGEAFMTSGCLGCNRPYFDGSPSSPYNYPRELSKGEFEEAVKQSRTYEGKNVFKAQKLLKVRAEYSNRIEIVKITGDFFVHPEDGLAEIEKSLAGCPINKNEIKARIEKALENCEAFGFDSDSLAEAIMGAIG